jgi:hypothetical protein
MVVAAVVADWVVDAMKVAVAGTAAPGALRAAKKEVRVSEVVTIPAMRARAKIRSIAMNTRLLRSRSACATRATLHNNQRQCCLIENFNNKSSTTGDHVRLPNLTYVPTRFD